MAAQKVEKKRKKRRKARTEVSSSSSSDSESSDSPTQPLRQSDDDVEQNDRESTVPQKLERAATSPTSGSEAGSEEPVFTKKAINPEQAFEEFYLQQATKEFANDLDKLRSTPDFNERSVPILIAALKQGGACFGVEERRKIGAATIAAAATGGESMDDEG